MDCIENFKGMQDCFREYPEVYGGELEEEEVEKEALAQPEVSKDAEGLEMPMHQIQAEPSAAMTTAAPQKRSAEGSQVRARDQEDQSQQAKRKRAKEATAQVQKEHSPLDESDRLVPKAAHDATTANEGK